MVLYIYIYNSLAGMYIGSSMAGKPENAIINLKAVVDKTKNEVIFIESNSDFVDVLLSFLTIPLGTIIKLARNQSLPSGMNCINNLHGSVESMDDKYFNFPSHEAGKGLTLSPKILLNFTSWT